MENTNSGTIIQVRKPSIKETIESMESQCNYISLVTKEIEAMSDVYCGACGWKGKESQLASKTVNWNGREYSANDCCPSCGYSEIVYPVIEEEDDVEQEGKASDNDSAYDSWKEGQVG